MREEKYATFKSTEVRCPEDEKRSLFILVQRPTPYLETPSISFITSARVQSRWCFRRVTHLPPLPCTDTGEETKLLSSFSDSDDTQGPCTSLPSRQSSSACQQGNSLPQVLDIEWWRRGGEKSNKTTEREEVNKGCQKINRVRRSKKTDI